jgi:membrane protein DedA with SNARE-associated domain
MRPVPIVLAAVVVVTSVPFRRRLGRVSALLIAVIVAALLVYGLEVVPLPKPEEAVATLGEALGAWTYALVGLLAFLEAAAFVGLVAPGEVAVVFGGLIAARGDIELVPLIATVWFAALSGDFVSYWFGRVAGRGWAIRHGSRFGITPARIEWAERYFAAHGGKTILVGRFVGIVRALAPFVAGTSRMPLRRFLLADVVGSGLWATAFSVLGFVFWQSLDHALELVRRGKLGLAAVLAVTLCAIAVYRLVHDPKRRQALRAWWRKTANAARRRRPKARPERKMEPGLDSRDG